MSILEQNILIANVNYHVGHWVAIYVADITYRSEVIQLHIDLLANSRGPQRRSDRSRLPAETARPQNRSAGPRASRLRLLSS